MAERDRPLLAVLIDAMDILHGGRFDGFVLVSSDSDFTALANRLREDGLSVIGIGEKKTPEALRNVCNRFIFIENIGGNGKRSGPSESADTALPLIRSAIDKIDQEDEWYNLSTIANAIMAAHPDFDTRSYGHNKFSSMVKEMPQFEMRKEAHNIYIRLKRNKG